MSIDVDTPLAARDVNTYDVGTIVSYDPETRRASVQPDPKTRRYDDDDDAPVDEPQSILNEVPVEFWGNGRFHAICDVKPGDYCEIHYGKYPLDTFKDTGSSGPVDERKPFSINNAVCRVGMFRPAPNGILPPTNGMVIGAVDQSSGDFGIEFDGDLEAVQVAAPHLARVKADRLELVCVDLIVKKDDDDPGMVLDSDGIFRRLDGG